MNTTHPPRRFHHNVGVISGNLWGAHARPSAGGTSAEFTFPALADYPVGLALWHWSQNHVPTPVSGDQTAARAVTPDTQGSSS